MHKSSVRELAVRLRKEGFPYTYISKQTGLSKSTLSGWLTDIPYTPNSETIASLGKARAAATERKAQIRQEELKEIKVRAAQEIGGLSSRDQLMFGLGLYMGEGAKTQDIVRMVNADPLVISCTIAWFRLLGVKDTQLSARVFLYPDSDIEKSLQFWSETTSIPRVQFQKTYIDQRTDKKQKKNRKLPHGTFHLSVRAHGRKEFGVILSRRILALLGAVSEEFKRG